MPEQYRLVNFLFAQKFCEIEYKVIERVRRGMRRTPMVARIAGKDLCFWFQAFG